MQVARKPLQKGSVALKNTLDVFLEWGFIRGVTPPEAASIIQLLGMR